MSIGFFIFFNLPAKQNPRGFNRGSVRGVLVSGHMKRLDSEKKIPVFTGLIPVIQPVRPDAFPGLRVIGAHFGGWSVWDRAEALLPGFPNLWVDTSSSFHWLGKERALRIIRAFGADHVLFGTDYPMWPQQPEIDFLCGLPLAQEEKEKILGENALRFYDCKDDKRPET